MVQMLRVEGSRSRRIGRVAFYRCPKCGDCQDTLSADRNGTVECFACKKSSPRGAFTIVKKKRVIAQCAHCGQEVPFVPSAVGIIGPLCSNLGCSNYVAVAYANTFVQPSLVLDVSWNRTLRDRAERVAGGLLLARCRSRKDHLVFEGVAGTGKARRSQIQLWKFGRALLRSLS
jgi:hypothetical protein